MNTPRDMRVLFDLTGKGSSLDGVKVAASLCQDTELERPLLALRTDGSTTI